MKLELSYIFNVLVFILIWIPILTIGLPVYLWSEYERKKIICARCGYKVKVWNSHVHCKCGWTIFKRRGGN